MGFVQGAAEVVSIGINKIAALVRV